MDLHFNYHERYPREFSVLSLIKVAEYIAAYKEMRNALR